MNIAIAEPRTAAERMFRAFGNRTRLRILHLLLDGEMCVADLVTVLGIPQPKASRHLRYLADAGLVAIRRRGLWRLYSLCPARSSVHRKLIDCVTHCLDEIPEIRDDRARARQLRQAGGCWPP